MPAIIKRVEKSEKDTLSCRIDASVLAKLDLYEEYTNVPKAQIVETAIAYVINADAEFLQTITPTAVNKKQAAAKAQGA